MEDQSPAFLLHKLVTEMDKAADTILHSQFGLSYNRFHFLLVLYQQGIMSQHSLALALGYSDPAISNMVQVLATEDYVTVKTSGQHRRKRLVELTPKGKKLTLSASSLLNKHFHELMQRAGINVDSYHQQTQALLETARRYRAV